jgi:hypothetical protein
MDFEWTKYAPLLHNHGCKPPPGDNYVAMARMEMLARFFPTLPLECTYYALLGDCPPCVRSTQEWKAFYTEYGSRIEEARKRVCVVSNYLVAFTYLAPVPIVVKHAENLVQDLLVARFFHAAGVTMLHLRSGGTAHRIVTEGVVTHNALEKALMLKPAGIVYLDHPDPHTTIVLLPRGFTTEVLSTHVTGCGVGGADEWKPDQEGWGLWVRACRLAPKRAHVVPTPDSKIAFATMVRAMQAASADRVRWSAVQMLAPHTLESSIARAMYDIVCDNPTILERVPALHDILQSLANGSTLDKLKVTQDGQSLGAWVYVYAACEDKAFAHLRIKEHLHPTAVKWRKQSPRASAVARTVTPVNAERAFLLNILS